MEAVVYTSRHGHTAKYADLLGKKINLPVYDLDTARTKLEKNAEVIYLTWMRKSKAMELKKALKSFQIKAVCVVGMSPMGGTAEANTRSTNEIPESIAVFYLQGGFDFHELTGMDLFTMKPIMKSFIPYLEKKPQLEPEEECMLRMFKDGGNCVSIDNLSAVLEWYRNPVRRGDEETEIVDHSREEE